MKKTVVTDINSNYIKCARTFGDGSIGLVLMESAPEEEIEKILTMMNKKYHK